MKRVLQTAAVLALLVATVLLASLQIQPAAAQRPQPPYPALFLRREPLDAATRAEGEALLQRMRRRWSRDHEQLLKDMAAGRGRCGSMSGHLFIDEQVNYGQEVRLFALGYPEVAARWAGPAMQVDRPGHEQRMAQAMQAWLWKAGWPGADEPLVKLCREAPLDQWSFGPSLLAFGDSSGKHLGFLREQARRGRSSAFDALTYRADAEALEILKGSKDNDSLLPRLEALNSGTWPDLVKSILRKQGGGEELRWALRVALEHGAPWLEDLLYIRLARGMDDVGHDDVLVALATLGGRLTAEQQALLRRNGYACEPRARLVEMLKERNYPP